MNVTHSELEQIEADGKQLGLIEAKSMILDAMIVGCTASHSSLEQTSSIPAASAAQLRAFLATITEKFGITTDHLAEAVNDLAPRNRVAVPPLTHKGWDRLLTDVKNA